MRFKVQDTPRAVMTLIHHMVADKNLPYKISLLQNMVVAVHAYLQSGLIMA